MLRCGCYPRNRLNVWWLEGFVAGGGEGGDEGAEEHPRKERNQEKAEEVAREKGESLGKSIKRVELDERLEGFGNGGRHRSTDSPP